MIMPNPNQLTACATATRQGIYKGYVRMYDSEMGKYGLLYEEFYFGPRTRDRAKALKAVREVIKSLKGMSVEDQHTWLEENQTRSLWKSK